MKKCLVLLAFLTLICVPALAGGPTGGVIPLPGPELISRSADLSVSGTNYARTGDTCTWVLTDTSGKTGRVYFYAVGKDDQSHLNPSALDTQYQIRSSDTTFTWTCYDPGSYGLIVTAYDSADSSTPSGHTYMSFTVVANPDGDDLQTAADILAAQCMRSTEYATALAIYDWLTENVEYDDSYTWFTADAAILHGRAVCNGFAKAFTLIASKTGLQSTRVSGRGLDANGQPDDAQGHAWNLANIEGQWYALDATWDIGGAHLYFLVNDSLIRTEHCTDVIDLRSVTADMCTSMARNYYIVEGKWTAMCYPALSFVNSRLREGWHTFDYTVPDSVETEIGTVSDGYARHLMGVMTDSVLSSVAFAWQDGTELTAPDYLWRSAYAPEDWTLSGMVLSSGGLTMPAGLECLEEYALAGTRARHVTVNEGCLSIGANAFEGMELWSVTIPDSVTEIDGDAFEGILCEDTVVLAPEGSAAEAFARAKGLITAAD